MEIFGLMSSNVAILWKKILDLFLAPKIAILCWKLEFLAENHVQYFFENVFLYFLAI